jgi:hypothetical protein
MRPVAFMRLKKAAYLDAPLKKYRPRDLTVQVKLDGFKLFGVKDKAGKVRLYSRRGKNITSKLPGIETSFDTRTPPGTSVLGELVYMVNGKQQILSVSKIVQSTPARAVEQTAALGGRLEYRIYDVLEFEGERVHDLPLVERQKLVTQLYGRSRGDVRAVKSYPWSQRRAALRDAQKQNAEGIVIKPKDSAYIFNGLGQEEPTGSWFKYKPPGKAKEADVILRSYRAGKAKLIFKAYQYEKGKLIEVGQVSGLPKTTEKKVKKLIDDGKDVVVEVSYQERMPSKKLRHMGWIRMRPDKPKKSAKINPGTMPTANPRTSVVKVALADQAVNYDEFEDFAEAYWNECARGMYWVPTDNEAFDIDAKAQSQAKAGKFLVYCNPLLALTGKNAETPYLAEINATNVLRSKIDTVRGETGAKIRIKDLQDAYVTRVLTPAKAKRSWRYQQGLLPSSKDQLMRFWKKAHLDKKRKEEKEEKRLEKKRKRLEARERGRQNPSRESVTRLLPSHINNPHG